MLVPDRRRHVLEHVRRHGSAQVEQLAATLGVSAWTVRRDLTELEAQGHLRRARGGAYVESGPASPAPRPGTEHAEAKARIAALAAQRIPDGATVMVLAGSTTDAVLPHLMGRELTVVTNGLETAHALRHAPGVSVVVVGGVLHREQMTLLGPLAERTMAELHVDLMIAGAWGVDPGTGVTGAKIIQAGHHRAMLRHTDALMVLADASKLGRRGPTLLAGIEQVTTLVSDSSAPAPLVDAIRERGPEVVLA